MSVKSDLMKQIEATVQRKKDLAKEVAREKTIAHWAAEFFSEAEKAKKLEKLDSYGELTYIAVNKLNNNLRTLDRKVYCTYNSETEILEIHWSSAYVSANNCDPVMSLDAASAFFQNAMESIKD